MPPAGAVMTLRVYGPGGPKPAVEEAAAAFEAKIGVAVQVTVGPTAQWLEQAKTDADAIFSGSEHMMTDFVEALEGRIAQADIQPLYLRPLAILVRHGNPKKIRGFKDLARSDVKILVVNGAGQTGAWEDMAGRDGRIESVRAIRRNIVDYAKNSAEARQTWVDRPEIDVWLIWNIWQVANPGLAEVVPLDPRHAIYRDTGVVLTALGKSKPAARQFVEFLESLEAARIFGK